MSIIEIDSRPIPKILMGPRRLSWQQKFRRNLYQSNYDRSIQGTIGEQDVEQQQKKNQGVISLLNLIKQSKSKVQSFYQSRRQFYDPQHIQPHYSPYSVFIPIQGESYMNDQIVNTFSYISHLYDTAKRNEAQKHYVEINEFFKGGKKKGQQFVQQQWMKVKQKYLCRLDTIKASTLFIELMRKGSKCVDELYGLYGKGCLKKIFFYRITRTSMYIRATFKMHKNLQISLEVGEQINEKTLPLTMKTWYCAICFSYDCLKHKLENKVADYKYEYVSEKNRKKQAEHIQHVIKLLKAYDYLKQDNSMSDVQQKKQSFCSDQCYKKLKKTDILKLNMSRHKLISPLAKALLKLGIQMFSYSPCQIHKLFTPAQQRNQINCNLIFIHFVEECNLIEMINMKLHKDQIEYLKNQDFKMINCNIKISMNKKKTGKTTYLEKRVKNQNPEFAVCMHNFIGHPIIDPRCLGCVCRQRGYCLPSCLCGQSCEIMRIGCGCKGQEMCQTDKCICFVNKLECHPEVCGECFPSKYHNKKTNCRNDQILRQSSKRIIIGASEIPGAGLGAFAGQNYHKNDLVSKYSGEHLISAVDYIRQTMIKDLSFYNFDSPNGKTVNASIDARFMGNKARFINHGNEGEQNLKSETITSNGTQYIALYAIKDIKQGEQLSFNYDGNGELYANHREKYPFIKPPRKNN